MIVLTEITSVISKSDDKHEAVCALYADTKEEVSGTLDVIGLPSDYELFAGSSIITAAFDIGLLKSDGSWTWKE